MIRRNLTTLAVVVAGLLIILYIVANAIARYRVEGSFGAVQAVVIPILGLLLLAGTGMTFRRTTAEEEGR